MIALLISSCAEPGVVSVQGPKREVWRVRIFPAAMALTALLSIAFYVFIVRGQGGLPAWWLFTLMGATAVAAAVSALLNDRRRRRGLLLAATVVAAGLGLLTLTSIGLPLIVTAALGIAALANDSKQPQQ